ncbi:transposase [compost metagenome]
MPDCLAALDFRTLWRQVPKLTAVSDLTEGTFIEARRNLVLYGPVGISKWGSVFTDDQMAAAMIDRLAHHGHLLIFEGESYRMKNALMKAR